MSIRTGKGKRNQTKMNIFQEFKEAARKENLVEKNLMPDIQKIVDTKGAAKVGGIMVDMFTASMINQIYNKVNDQNKKRMENSNISTLVDIAQRMMQKSENNPLEEVSQQAMIRKAIDIASSMAGNYTGAIKRIEAIKKGLSKNKNVEKALRLANEELVGEGMFSVKLDKPYKRGDEKMYMDIIKKYGGKNLKFSPPNMSDPELDITFDGGDFKKIKSNLPNKGKGSEWISEGRYSRHVKIPKIGSKEYMDNLKKSIDKTTGHLKPSEKPGLYKDGKKIKDVDAYLKSKRSRNEEVNEGTINEGTWAVPDSYRKLYNLNRGFMQSKMPATSANAKKLAKDIYSIFGDDLFFDELGNYEDNPDPKVDLRDVIKKHLEPWKVGFSSSYQIVSAPEAWYNNVGGIELKDEVQEMKRGKGNIKPTGLKSIKVNLSKMPEAVNPAQQAAIAIAKKEKEEKNESIFNSYRRMVEMWLDEEVANITVDPQNKIPTPADQNKHSLEIVKQARRFGIKASQLGKHIRIQGNKKAVNDFLRIIIGKSTYGDPTEKDTSTPQIDKMLTKGLK